MAVSRLGVLPTSLPSFRSGGKPLGVLGGGGGGGVARALLLDGRFWDHMSANQVTKSLLQGPNTGVGCLF